MAGECRVDISTTKKTPTLGLHRIAKLLGNENKMNRSSGSSGLYNTDKITSNKFLYIFGLCDKWQLRSHNAMFVCAYCICMRPVQVCLELSIFRKIILYIQKHVRHKFWEKESEIFLPRLHTNNIISAVSFCFSRELCTYGVHRNRTVFVCTFSE